jgi:hypothetical protein
MNNYTINNNQLTFLDARFYQCGENKYVPSVTHILDCYPKGAQYYEWLKKHGEDSDNIRDEAGRRGSVVHNLTERYDNGEEVSLINNHGVIDYKISEWSMFERYVDFRNRFAAEIFYTEKNIISEKLGFAGTLDRVMNIEGKTLLVDIKTSGAIYNSYWLQLAAYEQQNGTALKWKWTKDNPGELPPLEQVKLKGKTVYDNSAQTAFFAKFWSNLFNSATPAVAGDDLPF